MKVKVRPSKRERTLPSRTRDFRVQASAFCKLVSSHSRLPIRRFLRDVHQSLPGLYAAGLRLPTICPDRRPVGTRVGVPEWRRLYRSLGARLGHRRYYSEVFNAYDRKDSDALIGDLADDLADIYGDLTNGFRCWQVGDYANAVWEWRFMCESHWGEHATSALRALYWLQRDAEYGTVPAMPNGGVQRTATAHSLRAAKSKRRLRGPGR
jgi:hypothetical protein